MGGLHSTFWNPHMEMTTNDTDIILSHTSVFTEPHRICLCRCKSEHLGFLPNVLLPTPFPQYSINIQQQFWEQFKWTVWQKICLWSEQSAREKGYAHIQPSRLSLSWDEVGSHKPLGKFYLAYMLCLVQTKGRRLMNAMCLRCGAAYLSIPWLLLWILPLEHWDASSIE